jgi:hypothetical protein
MISDRLEQLIIFIIHGGYSEESHGNRWLKIQGARDIARKASTTWLQRVVGNWAFEDGP